MWPWSLLSVHTRVLPRRVSTWTAVARVIGHLPHGAEPVGGGVDPRHDVVEQPHGAQRAHGGRQPGEAHLRRARAHPTISLPCVRALVTQVHADHAPSPDEGGVCMDAI